MNPNLYTDKDAQRQREKKEISYRTPYRRDYARLIHAPSFRRLQGKTQLFPGAESDFFRNRLTHSLEVAQIAESIAYKLNDDIEQEGQYENFVLDTHLVRFAAIAHDLGHPPFGHLGEEVLNERMAEYGGFEGNAQTLHILTKLEKRVVESGDSKIIDGDNRIGLDLTYRSLASILKYDNEIPLKQRKLKTKQLEPKKGYYACDRDIVKKIKEHVAPNFSGKFKSVECAIMDVADDIAYSTYDLEDALKGGFITIFDILSTPGNIWEGIIEKVNESLRKEHEVLGFAGEAPRTEVDEAVKLMYDLFDDYLFEEQEQPETDLSTQSETTNIQQTKLSNFDKIDFIVDAHVTAKLVAQNNALRTDLTSYLVNRFITNVKIEVNEDNYPLSVVYLNTPERKMVEILKRFNWEYIILSHRLKIVAYRGTEIVGKLFDAFSAPNGSQLLPDDFQNLYKSFNDPVKKMRVICDFIAGMTDRYAVEFYSRLTSESPQTMYKPI
jgi:dGTPase